MQHETNQLKKLPFAVTKSDLVKLYINQLPEDEIRYEINIIFHQFNRSIRKKTIPHNIFMMFVEKYGTPKGYEI